MWKSRRDFEAEIIAKAWEDKNFKARLLANPKAIVEEMSGESLPKEMQVSVFEESPKKVCVVLPKNPDEELSEDELEQVAGGVGYSPEDRAGYINSVFSRL